MNMKKTILLILGLLALILICIAPVMAQDVLTVPDTSPSVSAAPQGTGDVIAKALAPVIEGLAGKYGWLTTVIMVVGTLRILFKPIMMAVENTVAKDPDKLAKLQAFEAGPIFKVIAFVLDFGGSIKLPAVKAAIK